MRGKPLRYSTTQKQRGATQRSPQQHESNHGKTNAANRMSAEQLNSMCFRATMTELAWRRTQPYAVVSTAVVGIVFCGAPDGPRSVVLGGGRARAGGDAGALCGAPDGPRAT
eukprot:6851201-Pyramimonas_sp.AAC.1